jgi:hypothetical protein
MWNSPLFAASFQIRRSGMDASIPLQIYVLRGGVVIAVCIPIYWSSATEPIPLVRSARALVWRML